MNFRPKTLRRLLILAGVSIGTLAIGSVVISIQLHRYEHHLLELRDTGMTAYQHGHYREAVEALSKYLSNDRIDSPAIFACAVSRAKIPQPDMGNLLDARRQFDRYLELNSGDVAAEHQLLAIYQQLHYSADAIKLADSLLALNPADIVALSTKLQQFVRDQKFQAALPISMRLNELAPDDLRSQETTYFLLSATGQPTMDVTNRADGMLKTHPKDPRFEMLRAVAAYFTGDLEGARGWLKSAARITPTDTDFTLMLVSDFDRLQMWDDAMDLLKRANGDSHASTAVKSALAQRLWEFKDFSAARALLNEAVSQNASGDSRLIGLQALIFLKDAPDFAGFQKNLKSLQNRTDDMVAIGWSLLLRAESVGPSDESIPPLSPYLEAERADPDNPNIRYCLARQYDRMGESELALQCFKQVTKMQPEWPAPFSDLSAVLLGRGESTAAIRAAQAACDRFPKSFSDHLALLNAKYADLTPQAGEADIHPVLELAQKLHDSRPRDEAILAKQVDLLARMNRRSEAVELALSAGSDADPPQPSTLRALSIVDRTDHLCIAEQLAHGASSQPIKSANDAAAIFDVYLNAGNAEQAKRLLPLMEKNGWRLTWLQARDSLGDASTIADWTTLLDESSHRLDVQLAALHSPMVRKNRQLTGRTIDRIQTLTGTDGIEWKLARARWLLDGADDVKTHASAAAELMEEILRICPDYVEPRILWSDAMVHAGDVSGAITGMKLALRQHPDESRMAQKLSDLQSQQGAMTR